MNILDIRVEDLPEGTTHYDLEEYYDFASDSCLKVDSKGTVYSYSDGRSIWIRFSESLDEYTGTSVDPNIIPVTIQDIIDAQITDKNILPVGLKDMRTVACSEEFQGLLDAQKHQECLVQSAVQVLDAEIKGTSSISEEEPGQVVKETLEDIQKGRPSPYHLINILGDKKYFDYYDFIDCGRATGHVQRPETEHVLKKLFVPYRGHKSELEDVKQCIWTLEGLRDKLIKEGEGG